MKKNFTNDSEKLLDNFRFNSEIDKQFFKRVYSTPSWIYENRLSLLKIKNKNNVLDAGCGFGQWTIALSTLNKKIHAMDADRKKVTIAKSILQLNEKNNISYQVSSSERLPFSNKIFDAIICYSVIYRTDYKKSIKEFYRVLKPDGIVYVVANGLGWYLYNLITGHSSAKDFNARMHFLETISASIEYYLTGKRKNRNGDIVLSPKTLARYMRTVGFREVINAEEGHIQFNENIKLHPFYPKKYLGLTNVFEIWAKK